MDRMRVSDCVDIGFRFGTVRREIPRAENGKRCQTPSAPVLLFSCRRGPRTRRPRLRRNRGQTEPRGRPRKFLKCVPGHSAPRARQDGGGVLQAKDVQFLQRGRSEAHEGARSWKPHRVRGGDGGEGLRTPVLTLLSMKRPLTILPVILLLRDNFKNDRIFQITALMLM